MDYLLPSLNLGELFIRGTMTYVGLMFLFRIVGRREAGGLGLTDLLVVLLAVNAASSGLTSGSESLGDSLVLVLTVLLWSVLIDAMSYRWPRMAGLFKAKPRPLIDNGRLNRKVMHREFMTEDEVLSQLRLHGIEDLTRIHRACIEPNGMVSVILREPRQVFDSQKHPGL